MGFIDKLIRGYLRKGDNYRTIISDYLKEDGKLKQTFHELMAGNEEFKRIFHDFLMTGNTFKETFHELRKEYNPLYSKWYNENSKNSLNGKALTGNKAEDKEILYMDLLQLDKQSLAFYVEILPFFYSYIVSSGLTLYKTYTLLDIGPRSGAGSNLYGQLFSAEKWGFKLKLLIDSIDIEAGWNEFMRLNPFINKHSNDNLYDMESDSYDICLCSHTIEHLDDPVAFVLQLKRVARKFAVISCPFEEKDPIPGHHTITLETINKCAPKKIETYKSVNRWREDLECVIFVV